jgi:hypothetical protein
MAYFVFLKNFDNISRSLYKIAENQYDLDNLNIMQSEYKIIEDSESNFNLVKFGNKYVDKYNNNNITYVDQINLFDKISLKQYINNFKDQIKQFLDNNPNHPLFTRWNDYSNQLSSLNLDSITYPLDKSLEQYFNDLGQPSLNHLQIP